MSLTPDDIARLIDLAAALLSEAPGFTTGPQDASALEILAAAIADRRVILQADVLQEIRDAWERAGLTPPPEVVAAIVHRELPPPRR